MDKVSPESKLKQLQFEQNKLRDQLDRHQHQIDQLEGELKTAKTAETFSSKVQPETQEKSTFHSETPPPLPLEALRSNLHKAKVSSHSVDKQVTEISAPASATTQPPLKKDLDPCVPDPPNRRSPETHKPHVRSSTHTPRGVEQHVGKVWLVRLGVLSLLTGLIFLSNYAYQHFIVDWSPLARVIGLYSISTLLLFAGECFQKSKASLQSYGKVLSAGSLAALYYTSYAAHHIERLKVIDSPLIAGIVLTLTALFCLQYALAKESPLIATSSLALAFYSTSINPIGSFTLISSVILTLVSAYLLVKFKDLKIGFIGLIGGYFSYTYWQITMGQAADSSLSHYFVASYWIIGTAALFLCRPLKKSHAIFAFASLNNGLFFLLFTLNFSDGTFIDPLWPFAALLGGILLALALTMRVFKTHDKGFIDLHLAKGLGLITYALCLWLSGPFLAISLAIQAGVLLALATRRNHLISYGFAALAFLLSVGVYFNDLSTVESWHHFILWAIYSGIALIATKIPLKEPEWKFISRNVPCFVSIVALAQALYSLQLVSETLTLTFLALTLLYNGLHFLPKRFHTHKDPTIAHLFTGHAIVTLRTTEYHQAGFLTLALLVLASITTIQLLRRKTCSLGFLHIPYLILSYLALTALITTIENHSLVLALLAALPLALHYLANAIRSRTLTVLSMLTYPIVWVTAIVASTGLYSITSPVILWASIAAILHYALGRAGILKSVPMTSGYLLSGGTLSLIAWMADLTPHWPLPLAVIGLVYILCEKKGTFRSLTTIGLISILVAALSAIVLDEPHISRYLITSCLIASFCYFKFQPHNWRQEMLKKGTAYTAVLLTTVYSTMLTYDIIGSAGYSICWAIVGFVSLTAGLFSKESCFRSAGLALLGITVLHVYGIDVWKLNALLRILSFITLGIVLLAAGFIYCKKDNETGGKK